MKKPKFAMGIMASLVCSALLSFANPSEDALAPFIERGELPGTISIFQNGDAEQIACVGWADVDAKLPMTLDSAFMQCSQTKGFCGVTIAILVEEGKISLDDPVSKYIPDFKEMWVKAGEENDVRTYTKAQTPITIRMVMNHTAGFDFELPFYERMGGWSRKMPLRSVAAVAASQPLLFEPGTKTKYSNTGIDIGAAVVEVVTKQRWEDFLKERVLDPLGMTSTTFWPTDEQLAGMIQSYTCNKDAPAKYLRIHGQMQPPFNDKFVFASAGAGLWTTARDQLKFYRMLMHLGLGDNGVRILKEETVKEILATSTRPKGMGGYSLGLNAPEEDSENAWFGHGGAWGSNCEVNWHKKQLKLWVVQLTGNPRPWEKPLKDAAATFFAAPEAKSSVDEYTGRLQ